MINSDEIKNDYPPEIPVAALLRCHAEYRADLQTQYSDLYCGGHKFEKNKDKYLRIRQLESSGSAGGRGLRKARLACASYIPSAAGILDWIAAATFQAEPAIIADSNSEDSEYYHRLNTNCDGAGHDLPSLLRSRLIEYMLHNRSYISVEFPAGGSDSIHARKSAGGYDAKLRGLNARDVTNWNTDTDGSLEWVLTHHVECVRETPWAEAETEVHTWTYVTRHGSYTYEASCEVGSEFSSSEKCTAKLVSVQKNDLGILPIIQVKIHGGPWVMDRIAPIAIALFNREASLQFALDQSAYAMMVVQTEKDISSLVASEVAAIKLQPNRGESVSFAAPPTEHFNSLQKSCEHLLSNMYLAVQAMALQAASHDSNGRQSGVAKFRDFGAIAILISTFAAAIRDSVEGALTVIQAARGDLTALSVTGLNQFDVQSRDVVMSLAKSFLEIPSIPDTARRWTIAQVSDLMLADAPTAMRSLAKSESLNPSETIATKEVEINGAVAQGLLALMGVLISPEEARAKLGFNPELPEGVTGFTSSKTQLTDSKQEI